MTFLYFVLDIVFYNYTSLKTNFLLLSFLEQKEKKWIFFASILLIDCLLLAKGKLLILYTTLYLLNKKIKCSYQYMESLFLRFIILYILYKIGVFCLFHTFTFEIFGFLIHFLMILIMHKKA